jgi:methanogenic corrinoid protein MtbC1
MRTLLSPLASDYLQALRRGDAAAAGRLIHAALDSQITIGDLYIHVFQPVLYEVGRLWETNELSVADEHFCTAATQNIMAQLYPRVFVAPTNGRRMIGACISGEHHEIGIRMVCDFFQMNGWETFYLGARMPVDSLLRMVDERRPELLALSATLQAHVDDMARTIAALRGHCGRSCPRVLVGGQPFNMSENLAAQVGADAHAPRADLAVERTQLWKAA